MLLSLRGSPGPRITAAAIASSLAVPLSIQAAASRCASPAAPTPQLCPAGAAFHPSHPPCGILLLRQQDCKEGDPHPLPGVVSGQLSWPRKGGVPALHTGTFQWDITLHWPCPCCGCWSRVGLLCKQESRVQCGIRPVPDWTPLGNAVAVPPSPEAAAGPGGVTAPAWLCFQHRVWLQSS